MSNYIRKAVTYNAKHEPLDCLFCRIQQRLEPGVIVYEDNEFVVFKTIQPVTHTHLLVTPREHITNIDSLCGHEDANLIRKMIDIGKISLESINPEYAQSIQNCFHIPPFNSIDHLHLHAISQPETKGFFNSLKYLAGKVVFELMAY